MNSEYSTNVKGKKTQDYLLVMGINLRITTKGYRNRRKKIFLFLFLSKKKKLNEIFFGGGISKISFERKKG